MPTLGINISHDASAAITINGEIVASAAEERFSRAKNDGSFPEAAIQYCLDQCGLSEGDIDVLALPRPHDPLGDLSRLILPDDVYSKIDIANHRDKYPLWKRLFYLQNIGQVYNIHHHKAHAASAYYTGGIYDKPVLIVTMDGAGNDYSNAIWLGKEGRIELLKAFPTASSIGWFYALATESLGWVASSQEWKLMGLAPYGTPRPGRLDGFHPVFADGDLVTPHRFAWSTTMERGTFAYHGLGATALKKIADALGPEDFAAEVQRVSEEQAFNLILPWLKRTGARDIACSGGFFLNVKFNQKLWETGLLDSQWIFPDAGDSGLAAGAALFADFDRNPGLRRPKTRSMYLGPSYSTAEIEKILKERQIAYTKPADLPGAIADYLVQNRVVGFFQGRMELGPRALGSRSILMSPLKAANKDIVNSKIKFREAFRPFCPSLLAEKAHAYFDVWREELFMTTSFAVKPGAAERIPAVVHVDGTARPQMVIKETNPRFHAVISEFGKRTGEYIVMNTSFNLAGEPVVCSPRDALRTFFDSGIDVLVLEDCVIEKPGLEAAA